MENPTGEFVDGPLRLDFDRRVKLEFHGSRITSDAGLLAYRELDDALGLSTMASHVLADARTGKNGRHALVGLLWGARVRSAGRISRMSTTLKMPAPRSGDALDRRRQGGFGCSRIAEPNGALRDALADGGEEPLGARRSLRPMDRPRPQSPSAEGDRARHGF